MEDNYPKLNTEKVGKYIGDYSFFFFFFFFFLGGGGNITEAILYQSKQRSKPALFGSKSN